MNFKWQAGCWIANRKHWNTALLMLTHHSSSERDGFHYVKVLYYKVPIKGHKSYYRILIPQAWDQSHFEWASLYTCTYLSRDLTVICRTSTLDAWQRVHVAVPRCDPWLGVSVISQENLGEAALETWSLFLTFIETSGPWSWNMAFPKKQT